MSTKAPTVCSQFVAADEVVNSLLVGDDRLALVQLFGGVRRKPQALAARTLRVMGLLHERHGDRGLELGAELMRKLERDAV